MKEKITTASLTKTALDKLNAVRGFYLMNGRPFTQAAALEKAVHMLFDNTFNQPFVPEGTDNVFVTMEDLVSNVEAYDEAYILEDVRERAAEIFKMPADHLHVEETAEPGKYEITQVYGKIPHWRKQIQSLTLSQIMGGSVVVDGITQVYGKIPHWRKQIQSLTLSQIMGGSVVVDGITK